MTKPDQPSAEMYIHQLLDLMPENIYLEVGRMHNRRVNPKWTKRGVEQLRSHHVTLVSAGQATFTINGCTVPLRRGTLLFTTPGCIQQHEHPLEDRPTVVTARFTPMADDAHTPLPQYPSTGCFLSVSPQQQATFTVLMEQLFRSWIRRSDPVAYKAVSSLLQSILWAVREEWLQTESASRDMLMEDVRLILEGDPEANWSIAELARRVSLSEGHFSRRFRRHTGVPPKTYQFQSRMRYAHRQLSQGGLSVQEVAELLGYSDAFVFSRQFKKVWGVPPSKV